MPDEARGQFEFLYGQADLLARKSERIEADLRRVEAFASSGFVLTIILLREMLASGQLSQQRAEQLLGSAIGYLRRMYRLDELDPQERETIDTESLLAAVSRIEQHKGAQDLLVEVLAAVRNRAS